MIIYRLLSGSDKLESDSPLILEDHSFIKNIQIPISNVGTLDSSFRIDHRYMKNKYGISISIEEIQVHLAHNDAWLRLLDSEEDFCLIIEENVIVQESIEKMNSGISDLDKDWGVFFPFDKTISCGQVGDKPYLLGYYWGSCAYFLSKKGAEKLISLNHIKQPVDDEILEMGLKEELNIYIEDNGWFNIDFEKSIVHEGRLREISKTIGGYQAWSDQNRSMVREILCILSEMSLKLDINLALHAGTLLGYVRHGEIIPWDDDVDLSIEEQCLKKLKTAIEEDKRLSIAAKIHEPTNTEIYKVWMENGENIENYTYKFPFVDLWLYTKKGDDMVLNDGVLFPNVYKNGFKKVLFEGSLFYIPNNAIECMNSLYDGWNNKFKIFAWSHRLEKKYFKPFQIGISTDLNGRFLNYSIF